MKVVRAVAVNWHKIQLHSQKSSTMTNIQFINFVLHDVKLFQDNKLNFNKTGTRQCTGVHLLKFTLTTPVH